MPICIVPDVPYGTTTDSFATAVHQLNIFRNIHRTHEFLLGFRQPSKASSAFGYRVNTCAAAIQTGPFSDSRSILENHTIWPLYAYTLAPSLREAWALDQISLEKKYPWRSVLVGGRFPGMIIEKEHYECLDCVTEDLNTFGLAYWRTYHQLPGICHCIYHLSPLISRCPSCGLALRGHLGVLPVLVCPHCRGKLWSSGVKEKLPSPYQQMLLILKFLFNGNWCLISPNFRRSYYEIALRNLRLWPLDWKGALKISNAIIKRWRCTSTTSMSKIFSSHISVSEIRSALEGFDCGCNPILHIIILEHFNSTQRNLPDLFSFHNLAAQSIQTQFPLITGPFTLPLDKQTELLAALDEVGISRKIAFYLANDYVTDNENTYPLKFLRQRMKKVDSIVPWFKAYRHWLANLKRTRKITETRRKSMQSAAVLSRQAERRKKAIVTAIKSLGRSSRTKVWHTVGGPMRWAAKNCPEWLESVLPPHIPSRRRATGKRYSTAEHRKQAIVAAINALNDPSRTDVSLMAQGPIRWAKKHCAAWLESVLPPASRRIRYPTDQSRKVAILRMINAPSHPSRTELWNMVQGPMRWATKHDPDWLESVLPPSKRGQHGIPLSENTRAQAKTPRE